MLNLEAPPEGKMWCAEADIEVLPKQRVLLNALASGEFWRFLYSGGRWAGKTIGGVYWCLQVAAAYPGEAGTVIGPDYSHLNDVVLPTFHEYAEPFIAHCRESPPPEITLINGHAIHLRSAENIEVVGRGPSNRWIWWDEARWSKRADWQLVLATLRARGERGLALFTTTPRGKAHWLYDLFYGQKKRADYFAVTATSRENYLVDPSLLEEAESEYSIDWFRRQELEGEWVDPAGCLFQRQWFKPFSVTPPFEKIIRGWDLAVSTKTSGHHTVGVKLGITADADVYILDRVRGKWTWPQSRQIIKAAALSDGTACQVAMEKVGTQEGFIQDLEAEMSLLNHRITRVPRERDKMFYALPFANRACSGKVFIPAEAGWVGDYLDELCSFDGQEKCPDDQVDATTNAMQAATKPKGWIT
jgi:predicted phage terminase large subunit-like protein